jgi:hypothetical protein
MLATNSKCDAHEILSIEHFISMLPDAKQWFSPKEMAAIIGKTDQYIRDAFDNQKILGHSLNAKALRGDEKRKTYMIPREGVLLFLLETANFVPSDFMHRIEEILGNRSTHQLLILQKRLNDLVDRRLSGGPSKFSRKLD